MNILSMTDIGLVREHNEDICRSQVLGPSFGYGAVYDGMGGVQSGDVASALAADLVDYTLQRNLQWEMSDAAIQTTLTSALLAANSTIHERSQQEEDLRGMGTTAAVAVLRGNQLFVAHVGDSRIYLFSGGRQIPLTKDHSVVQSMVDRGEITEDEARIHPQKHYITRALGVDPTVDVDFDQFAVQETDRVLLCSDGLSNYFEQDMTELVEACIQAGSPQQLIDFANQQGGMDNITVVLMTQRV